MRFEISTGNQVAELYKLKDRGKIGTGYFADVIVFDEKTINERATAAANPPQRAALMAARYEI